MSRETKIVETPISKVKIEMRSWITGREKRALKSVFLENVKIDESGKTLNIGNSADIVNQAENKTIEIVIVSIDKETKGILDKVLDMRAGDFDFVMGEINKITAGEDFLS